MEAAGIEPASEDIQQKLSTCISSSLFSFSGVRRGKTPKNQPQEHFTHQAQGAPGSLSCSSTLLKNRRRELEKRHAYLLGSEWLCFCTYLSPPFREVGGISTCSFCLTISVESVRPHIQESIIFQPLESCQPQAAENGKSSASFFFPFRDNLFNTFDIFFYILNIFFQDLIDFFIVHFPVQMNQQISEFGHSFEPVNELL